MPSGPARAASRPPVPRTGPGGLLLLSPGAVMLGSWGLTAAGAALILGHPERFDISHGVIRQHGLDLSAFTWGASLWIATMMAAFLAGCGLGAAGPDPRRGHPGAADAGRAAGPLFAVNLALVGITLAWVGLAAARAGGIGGLVALTRLDAYAAREVLLDAKLFAGMRMCYGALPATGALAAALLARGAAGRERRLLLAVLGSDLVVLALLPLVMSQRLLLVQLLLAAWVAASMARGRLAGAGWLPPLAGLFLLNWILHEAVTNPDIDRGAVAIGLQKLGFYLVNDLYNSVRPLQEDTAHFAGFWTLRGLQVLTLTDGVFAALLADRLREADALRGGGEFSLLSGAFLDFGTVGAAVALMAAGWLCQRLFLAARGAPGAAAAYGQVAAALAVSVHGNYLAQQDFLFGLILTAGLAARARRPAGRGALA